MKTTVQPVFIIAKATNHMDSVSGGRERRSLWRIEEISNINSDRGLKNEDILTFVVGDVTLQDCAPNLLTLPEFRRRKNLIAMSINQLSVNISNQQSKTTDFSLGLYESFRIFKICLR